MTKHYRLVAGKKFYSDDKGILVKNDSQEFVEVPETDTEAKEVEAAEDEAVSEVTKMLQEARAQVIAGAEKSLGESQVKAVESIDAMLKGIAEAAGRYTKVDEGAATASFDLDEVKAGLTTLTKQRGSFSFEIKGAKDLDYLAKVTSEGDLTGDVLLGDRSPVIEREPVRPVFIEGIADVVENMTSDHLSYVEVVDVTGAPAVTAELGEIPEEDFTFQEFKAPLKKIAVINKHSVELLQDAPQLVAAIKAWLRDDMNLVTDNELLLGSGVGEHLTGIFGRASILNQAAVGTKRVDAPNLYDVIRVALTKVAVSGKGKFTANYVLLNPEDADALDLTKDENGQYVLPPFRSADGTTIKGAKVIENVAVTAGKFLVGDFRKLHIGTKGGIEVEMTNSDGDDFKHDILSVKLRRRIASYVRANDNGAFWTGDISDVIGWLTPEGS